MMLIYGAKLQITQQQYDTLNEAIRNALFICKKISLQQINNCSVGNYSLLKHSECLDDKDQWAVECNLMVKQVRVCKFYTSCQIATSASQVDPKFKLSSYSFYYKSSGWPLSADRKQITGKYGFCNSAFDLLGTHNLNFCRINLSKQIKVARCMGEYMLNLLLSVAFKSRSAPKAPLVFQLLVVAVGGYQVAN